MGDLVDSMLDLMRRLPPTRTEENVTALIGICPDYADDLLGSVDQPLKLRTDRATGKEYLACDYNRDGESYRFVTRELAVLSCRLGRWSVLASPEDFLYLNNCGRFNGAERCIIWDAYWIISLAQVTLVQ
jgi:hypothetical protein